MKRFINHIILAGVFLLAYSCAEPTEPTPAQQLPGDWNVEEYFVNGQSDGSNLWQRFILETDGTFVLVDQNDLFFGGEWTESGDVLTLTADDGSVFDFTIVYLSYEKMQVVQTFTSPTAGDIEIRYLMNRSNSDEY